MKRRSRGGAGGGAGGGDTNHVELELRGRRRNGSDMGSKGSRRHPLQIFIKFLLISQLPDQIFQMRLYHNVAVNIYFLDHIIA